jgi:fructose-1,6-bisphosphatase/inositol monophosphatase family enzyme
MKGYNDPVTAADKEAEVVIDSTLRHYFPNLIVIGEEEVPID